MCNVFVYWLSKYYYLFNSTRKIRNVIWKMKMQLMRYRIRNWLFSNANKSNFISSGSVILSGHFSYRDSISWYCSNTSQFVIFIFEKNWDYNTNTIHVWYARLDECLTHFNRPITLTFQHSAHRYTIFVSHYYTHVYRWLWKIVLRASVCMA